MSLLRAVNEMVGRYPWLDGAGVFFTWIGVAGGVWIALALVLLWRGLKAPGERTAGLAVLVALAIGAGMEQSLKHVVGRPRPPLVLEDLHLIMQPPAGFSFPSGHALTSFAAAAVIFAGMRSVYVRWTAMMMAALIALSRVFLGHHYPSDVMAGSVLGLTLGWCTWALAHRRSRIPAASSHGSDP